MTTPNLLPPGRVAAILGVSPRHVKRMPGLAPAYRVPGPTGANLYDAVAVEALRAEREALAARRERES